MPKRLQSLLRHFRSAERGNSVLIFALTLPVILGSVAYGVDTAQLHMTAANFQDAADAAALGAARELYITSGRTTAVQAIAESYAKANLGRYADTVQVVANVDDQGSLVSVTLTDSPKMYFAGLIGTDEVEVSASASARIAGGGRICVIGLNEKDSGVVRLKDDATITAKTCAVYSNSTDKSGLTVETSSKIEAELICSSGGIKGSLTSFQPGVTTDCPQAEDPLAGRATISAGGCDYTGFTVATGGYAVAKPGVYCDGIEVKPSATLILTEGVYVIKGGMVKVGNLSTLKAEYAGLYLADNATFEFGEGSTIDLNGARSGPMAGLLMFEDPAASLGNSYKVSSRNAKNLTGTIYLPKGALVIQGVQASTTTTSTGTYTVADKSAYTAIVVNRLELKDGPNLVLNTNYNATDVPVPDGIAPIGRNIWIEK